MRPRQPPYTEFFVFIYSSTLYSPSTWADSKDRHSQVPFLMHHNATISVKADSACPQPFLSPGSVKERRLVADGSALLSLFLASLHGRFSLKVSCIQDSSCSILSFFH